MYISLLKSWMNVQYTVQLLLKFSTLESISHPLALGTWTRGRKKVGKGEENKGWKRKDKRKLENKICTWNRGRTSTSGRKAVNIFLQTKIYTTVLRVPIVFGIFKLGTDCLEPLTYFNYEKTPAPQRWVVVFSSHSIGDCQYVAFPILTFFAVVNTSVKY